MESLPSHGAHRAQPINYQGPKAVAEHKGVMVPTTEEGEARPQCWIRPEDILLKEAALACTAEEMLAAGQRTGKSGLNEQEELAVFVRDGGREAHDGATPVSGEARVSSIFLENT